MTSPARLELAEQPDHAGLRERKKAATRQALSKAAMRLAIDRGLDNVLVEDIAEEAGVSTRTFNNYFASKYEAICALQQDRATRVGDALAARPAGEPLWESVTEAILSQFGPGGVPPGRADMSGAPLKDWIASVRLVITSPPLAGEYLKVQGMAQHHLADVIADRLGVSRETSMFPRVMAGAISAATQAAMERWLDSDPPTQLETLMRQSLQQFAEGMQAVLPPPSSPAD